jgi:hypothetical protein
MSGVTTTGLKAAKEIEQAAREMLAKEAQAYHNLTVEGDPERAFFAYLYFDKRPNVLFILSFADIITRLGAAWSPALRSVYFRMARMGRLLISTFHKPPSAHILGDDSDDRQDVMTYDTPALRSWTARRRAETVAEELDDVEDIDDFEEIEIEDAD